ncbi:hypothetical protein JQK19_20735 [Chromobacterium violaceum]|uniref:hypothetical protein n=1 Tax=Chromobacterium violaceum TaxID=536 RepID=UPI001BE73A34|nr:hypothetical protein [Chromobacterium violaceum]MBT2869660.1 hypothetical protein [Chromobacterium violaceum]
MPADVACERLRLSRNGGQAERDGLALRADRAEARGDGLTLRADCGGQALSLWTTETAWRDWLAPRLAAPPLRELPEDWLPLLAAWSLASLDDWQRELGLPPLADARPESAPAPAGERWRLTLSEGERRLPLYVDDAPPGWLDAALDALKPAEQPSLALWLALGWCRADALRRARPGDALPLLGAAEAPDRFWLLGKGCLGRARLDEDGLAWMDEGGAAGNEPGDISELTAVEVGLARLSPAQLAGWQAGKPLRLAMEALPLPRAGALAQGVLLRLDDGWALRIQTRASA